MTSFHIVLGKDFDLDAIDAASRRDERPQHAMNLVRRRLDAEVHVPATGPAPRWATLASKVIGFGAPQWKLASDLARRLDDRSVVYCTGEDTGVPLLLALARRSRRAGVTVFLANIDRPRARVLFRGLRWRARPRGFVSVVRHELDVARSLTKLPSSRIFLLDDHTDTSFFRPLPKERAGGRPMIASGGLEKRDYRTLAAATEALDVDVRVSAFSSIASKMAQSFPDPMPGNMVAAFYDWQPLRQLYCDADIVVVPLLPNNYGAGLTTVLEAMACRRPVIATDIGNVIGDLAREGAVVGVPAGEPHALRRAIERLLADPDEAERLATRGFELVTSRYSMARYVDGVVEAVRSEGVGS